jgi:hypothetical protein
MNINRLRPKLGEDLALFLSGVINDAMRDAVEAGLPNHEAVRIAFSLAQSWQTCGHPATQRHSTPCVVQGLADGSATCIYLADGTKARIRRCNDAAWIEVVPQDVLTSADNTKEDFDRIEEYKRELIRKGF